MDRLLALYHDGHEAYTGDAITPFKKAIRHLMGGQDPIDNIQHRLQTAIHAKLHLWPTTHTEDLIKAADLRAMWIEKTFLMASEPEPWSMPVVDVTEQDSLHLFNLRTNGPLESSHAFMELHNNLLEEQ